MHGTGAALVIARLKQPWMKSEFSKGMVFALLIGLLQFLPTVSFATEWQRVLTCDRGRAWVDVDTSERRRIQVVIRNTDAIRYLNTLGVNYEGRIGEDTELTFGLNHEVGIFSSADFVFGIAQSQFESKAAKKIGDEYLVKYSEQTYVYRDGSGLKLEFVRNGLDICNFYDARTQTCVDGRTHYVRDRYIGNWFFPDCKNQLSTSVLR